MKELKIIKHTTYTYETSDGREFDDENEAKAWQKHLSALENVCMLNCEYEPTKEIDSVCYVYVERKEQEEAFNAMQEYFEYSARLHGVGYYRYDNISDEFVNVESEIKELQHIIDKLKGGDKK